MAFLADTELSEARDDSLHSRFRSDVLAGLSQKRKAIPARWFYDTPGSELFAQITDLPEYYPTRTEIGILSECCAAVAEIVGGGRHVVEFGAGNATKIPLLLDCVGAASYVPIDISGEFLRDSCREIEARYPGLPVTPVEADFTRPVSLPAAIGGGERLGFFPGSTIGNMEPRGAVDLLRVMRATLGGDSYLLIGMDRVKAEATLLAAYDDAAGVTATFNRNLALRINRELEGTIPVDALRHRVVWNDERARIEMHLEARHAIDFEVAGRSFAMREGETIHTENSHKYTKRSAAVMLLAGGWDPVRCFMDEDKQFMVMLAAAMKDGIVP